MADFRRTPRYQRARQKIRRMRPDQLAILNTLALDESFADAEMRKEIAMSALSRRDRFRTESLDLAKRGSASAFELRKSGLGLRREGLNLRREGFEFEKGQLPISTGIGLAGVAASGFAGHQRLKLDTALAQQMIKDRRQLYPSL